MKSKLILICGLLLGLVSVTGTMASAQVTGEAFKILKVARIWDQSPHNAFTDLIRYDNLWYCAFREGEGHVSDDGKLRVIRSADGEIWKSVGLMEWEGPFACPTGLGTWRWSATWHDGMGYSIGYSGKDVAGCLYKTLDGKTWEVLMDNFFPQPETYLNESSLVFDKDGKTYCLLRRDKGTATALLGVSRPSYTQWKWEDLGVRVGGPKIIQLSDGRIFATVRLYDVQARTSLCLVDPVAGSLTECLKLPSGGDTSYAGMVEHEGNLWISYYSSHEEKTAIYLARVRIL